MLFLLSSFTLWVSGILFVSLALVQGGHAAHTQRDQIEAGDLAFGFAIDDPDLKISFEEVGFKNSWYQLVQDAYLNTPVGNALEVENQVSDWQLVAVRVDPCQSLLNRPHELEDSFCWPELRLVFQPVVRKVRALGQVIPYFADDRAIHVLYNFDSSESQVCSEAAGAGFDRLISLPFSAVNDLRRHIDQGTELPRADWLAFVEHSGQAVDTLVRALIQLRDPKIPTDNYQHIGLRPELTSLDLRVRQAFKDRLLCFLMNAGVQGKNPKEVTTFSLPLGREPVFVDEWVFIKFLFGESGQSGQNNEMRQEPIVLISAQDGTLLVDSGLHQRATMARDDDLFYIALDTFKGTPYEQELRENLILFIPDIASNRERIADDQQVRVPNSSCASCHKLNEKRFDFHNFSYFQKPPITVSPRVRKDVEHDLRWLSR